MVKWFALMFVLIWSTGFIVGRSIVGIADPNLFLLLRFLLPAAFFTVIAVVLRKAWPSWQEAPKHFLAGALLNGLYMGGSYWAIAHGLPAAMMSLLGSLQPLLTAVVATFYLRESVSLRVYAGLVIGILGVSLVLEPRLAGGDVAGLSWWVLLVAVASVVAITAGTVMQKTSVGKASLLTSLAIQNAAGAVVCGLLALVLSESVLVPGVLFFSLLAWAAFVLSGTGILLLLWLVRNGNATSTVSLLLLVPPLAAVQAYFLFDDQLNGLQMLGFVIALSGVVLCKPVAARLGSQSGTTRSE